MKKVFNKKGVVKFAFFVTGLFILFCLIFIIPFAETYDGSGAGPYNCSSCEDCTAAIGNASAGAIIYLNTSLTGINSTCINFGNKSNVVFDCINYSNFIVGNGSTAAGVYGINISSVSNNTVRNCNISNFYNGVYLFSSNNNTLMNMTVNNNSKYGIYLGYSSINNLAKITAKNNSNIGIYLNLSNMSFLSNIAITNSIYGIYLYSSNSSNLFNITLNNNSITGLELNYSFNNTLMNVISNNNSQYGGYIYFSSNNNLTNLVLNNNTYGLYIFSSNNSILTNINTSYNSITGLELNYSFNNTLINVISNNNSQYGGYIYFSSNNNLTNLVLNNNTYGLYIFSSNNSILTNINTSYNSITGLELNYSFNNTLMNVISNNNLLYGIFLFASNNNTLTKTISNNNSLGVYLRSSSYNTLSNGISNSNSISGSYMFDVNDNIFSNMTSTNNLYGLGMEGIVFHNTLKDSLIQFNHLAGLFVNTTGTLPQYNYFYNNYFNETTSYYNPLNYIDHAYLAGFNWSSVTNYFNVSVTSGKNIVGGEYLGGNYWANPTASGFSQNCTIRGGDRGDGICDTPAPMDSINYDYLPLVCYEKWSCGAWGTCNDGTQTRPCNDANLCQTYFSKPIDSQNCQVQLVGVPKSSGGSRESTFSQSFINILKDQPVEIVINDTKMDLTSITLNVKKASSNNSITIKQLDILNRTYLSQGLPVGKLYQAFEVEYLGINSEDILNATLNFKINKTFLEENNITIHFKDNRYWLVQNDIVGNLILYRQQNGTTTWIPLSTNFFKSDNSSHYFFAHSPGFSTFAIFFNKYDCLPNSARCSENNVQLCLGNSTWLVTETCVDTCNNRKCEKLFFKSNEFYIVLTTIVGGAILISLILLISRNKKKIREKKGI